MMGGRSRAEWIAEYETGHQNAVNRLCHTIGIPLIAVSLPAMVASWWAPQLWWPAVGAFAVGWVFQFVGHAFEGKPPEFFKDPRFLFVGLSWWVAKVMKKGN